jgi:hypothetical protein
MPVIISNLFICPRCEEGITSIETATACPSCGLPLGKQNVPPYTPPFTFTEQHDRLKDTEHLTITLADLPIEKANSIMNDALLLMETLPGKNTTPPGIRQMVKLAIRIGEIASAYEKYLEAGGKHFPSLFIKEQQQENQEQPNEPQTRVVPVLTPSTPGNGQ